MFTEIIHKKLTCLCFYLFQFVLKNLCIGVCRCVQTLISVKQSAGSFRANKSETDVLNRNKIKKKLKFISLLLSYEI